LPAASLDVNAFRGGSFPRNAGGLLALARMRGARRRSRGSCSRCSWGCGWRPRWCTPEAAS